MDLVLPGDPGWEQARVGRVFNARRPGRQPAAVLRAKTERDLIAGVRLAKSRGWRIAIRSGGHSWAAWSVRDDALLIDLGDFREMSYDPESTIVSVTPPVKGGAELRPYLALHGRFFGGGHCPTVGVGGFLLQGGQGYNARGWGWAAESIVAIDVVTAAGDLVRASATENSDLFWAARGSGPGFFGLVTRFHLQTRPLPKVIAETVHVYPFELFDQVMTWLHTIHATISPDVEIVAVSADGVLAVTGLALVDSQQEAVAALAPLETCPVIDHTLHRQTAVPSSFESHAARQMAANPEGFRYIVDNAWLSGPPAELTKALHPLFTGLPTVRSFVIWFSMAPLRELPDMAFSLQSEIYSATYLVYDDPADDIRLRAWLTDRMTELQPFTAGQYLGDSDFTARQVRFMGESQYQRLESIRARRDPDGVFAGYLTAGGTEPANVNPWES
ncbi:FAD-binding oxidoreductase [Actinoplanes derwentensis]|uniref:FAD/FMN-containing dehydrogenase n=1 Tax=Actinoplanes derwentensis TaxID=113562 RepID=A0A1H1URD2_9ACTN|nr:FAD-binding oxidoreductase [Actinoplanes derwentensis]GID88128.1 oxidoreductase [Actinoplanes derwentensis]SDS74419.1 FAD/FMN-containing dehydrogenase [Actinoplanes derwentensis]